MTNFFDKCYQEQNTAISIVSCKKPRMDDIPNICDGNDKMSKSVWTLGLPSKNIRAHLLLEYCNIQIDVLLSFPIVDLVKSIPLAESCIVFINFLFFQRLPLNYK